ncbi:MAG TPA: GspH/FimT family pseudopilin [Ramlibacter sp.]|nr:GspH/FimT family pseudopilin [Ramlibacter sp.]
MGGAQQVRLVRARPARPGFTLIELLITVSVLGVLMMVAVPSFNDAVLGNKLSGYANSFVASAQLARSEAIKRNAPVTMCSSGDGTACASGGWQQGWIVFNDTDGDAAVGSDETRVHYQQALATNFSFTGGVDTVVFQGTGLNASPGVLRLCQRTPSPGAQERNLSISSTGRVSVSTTRDASCP